MNGFSILLLLIKSMERRKIVFCGHLKQGECISESIL